MSEHPGLSPSPVQRPAPIGTSLPREAIRERLREGNRRGRLPEVAWSDDSTFRVALPSRPVTADLVCRVADADGTSRHVSFDIEVHRRPVWWLVAGNLACIVIGPWSTEIFFDIYSWYWQPPLCLLAAAWIAWRWPRRSLEDAVTLAPKWVAEISARLGVEPTSRADRA